MSAKRGTLGEKCATCGHGRGDHTLFVGRCRFLHVDDRARTAWDCLCKGFVEKSVERATPNDTSDAKGTP